MFTLLFSFAIYFVVRRKKEYSIIAIIYAIYQTITSRKLSDKWQKVLFTWGIFNLLFFCAYIVFWYPIQGCNANKMAEHYDKNSQKIEELKKLKDDITQDQEETKKQYKKRI